MPVKLVCPKCGVRMEMEVAMPTNCPRCKIPMTMEQSTDAPRPMRRAKSVNVMTGEASAPSSAPVPPQPSPETLHITPSMAVPPPHPM